MSRQPRLDYAGAVYHVTARGVQRSPIFLDDRDRLSLLQIMSKALATADASAFAFCLMDNHYHFVLQTREANLSVLMQRVNGVYSLAFNRRHGRSGHVFEGRYKALHVDRDAYLLEVCRYVDLNPVRAGLVGAPGQWIWSSYRAHVGAIATPTWLASMELLDLLAGQMPGDLRQASAARRAYVDWVGAGLRVRLWEASLREGQYLGDEDFVQRVKRRVASP